MRAMSEPHPLLQSIDWDAACAEATDIFRTLLRIDTTNSPVHPGNEIEACRYLEGVLGEVGIEGRILESAPGRGNLVCRLEGDGSFAQNL